jgi:hypothetical protein
MEPGCHYNIEVGFMMCGVEAYPLILFRLPVRGSVATPLLYSVPTTCCLGAASCVGTTTMIWLVFCFVLFPPQNAG